MSLQWDQDSWLSRSFQQSNVGRGKLCFIILCMASNMLKIPYRDVFIQSHLYGGLLMNEDHCGLHGPLQNCTGEISQVAVIEDQWEAFWGRAISRLD